jgi:hypothetical protein
MKLPEQKSERNKVIALIVIATVAVVYGTSVGVLTPLRSKFKDQATRITEIQDKLRSAELLIAQIGPDRTSNLDALRKIVETTEQHVLVPRLGNYLIGTARIIENCANRAGGLGPITVNEIGIAEIPSPPQQSVPNAFKTYSVRINLETGIKGLIRFLREIEAQNPYACVSNISITTDDAAPAIHKIVFEVQWPIWADQNQRENLRNHLDEAEKSAEKRNGGQVNQAP